MPAAPELQATVRTPRGEKTAERILDAAEARFAEHGYAGTSLRDVAAAVGLRTPSLYNHFASKEELYAAVLERGIRPVLQSLADFVGTPEDRARQRALLEQVMELLARRPDLARLVQFEVLTGGARLTPLLQDWIGPIFARAGEIIAAGPGAHRWSEAQVPLLVLALYHVVVGFFTTAPLYKDLAGVDLLSEDALAEQTRFLNEVVDRLLPDDGDEGGSRGR